MKLEKSIKQQEHNTTHQLLTSLIRANPNLEKVFDRFTTIYGHLWTSSISSPKVYLKIAKEWVDIIQHFDEQQIEKAIQICKYISKYPSPYDFIAAALDIDEPEEAWEDRENNLLAKKVLSKMDQYSMRISSAYKARMMFISAYKGYVKKLKKDLALTKINSSQIGVDKN